MCLHRMKGMLEVMGMGIGMATYMVERMEGRLTDAGRNLRDQERDPGHLQRHRSMEWVGVMCNSSEELSQPRLSCLHCGVVRPAG